MNINKALLLVWLSGLPFLLTVPSFKLLAQQDGPQERQMQEESPDAGITKPENVKRSPIRAILNKITIGANVGWGLNYYQQKLPYQVQRQGDIHFLSGIENGNVWYSNWLNNPQLDPTANAGIRDGQVSSDTSELKLSGWGHSLPLNLDLHVLLMDRFRIGGGVGLELFSIRPLDFEGDADKLMEYQPDVKSALALRYYGMLGTRVIRWANWDHSVDVRLGKKKFLTQFDGVDENVFFNLGFTMERHYSEYFRFTLRPAVEWFSYQANNADLSELKTSNPSFYIQAGVSLNYPRLPRCPIQACHIQLEHVHEGKEFRGQPLHRWQNPKYGQNHPELQRNLRRKKDDTEQQLQRRPARRSGRRNSTNFR